MNRLLALISLLLVIGCAPAEQKEPALTSSDVSEVRADEAAQPQRECDPDLELPDGFCAEVFHPDFGQRARHLAVRDNGDVYVAKMGKEGGLFALRDSDGDGRADIEERWNSNSGTGVELRGEYLYFSTPETIVRYKLHATELMPDGEPEIIVEGYPDYKMHASKAFAFDNSGSMYVNVGAPSNACQEPSRTAGVPGQDPCPLLETTAGVWRFDADELNQSGPNDGELYATGIRNGLAMAWNHHVDSLYLVQHGRDQLSELWPDLFTPEQRAELPAEQFFAVQKGSDFGWPYCYFDHIKGLKLLNPEYGGDGEKVGRCANFDQPVAAYPGHWAPNDLVFYQGESYPESYKNGAFIAFHGSWNRAPFVQQGYRVVFQPFDNGAVSQPFETFIDGFAQNDELKSPGSAKYRPTGLAIDSRGQLWVSDSRKGRIWRIRYHGT